MKVFIVVLMAILLPLQAAWSAAAVFCQHESRTTWHWGHHQHVVDAACQQSALHTKNPDSQKNNTFEKNATFQEDVTNNKNSKPYSAIVVNHSDHLTGNQLGLNPNPQVVPMQPSVQDHKAALQSLSPALYQSPVLEQPKPPVWPA
ncbi:MAG: hypothetical protein EOO69_12425 [Moraxellaceae bacterium]|nr:MAG: hypothetical protein EOO69_12425 [Moraxellaceae bacterium]